MKEGNYISIMTASRGYFVPFTQDSELLLAEIDRIHKKLDFTAAMSLAGCLRMTDAQAEEIHVISSSPGNRAFDVAMSEAEDCGVGQASANPLSANPNQRVGIGATGLDANQQVIEAYVRTMAAQHLSLKKGRTRRLLNVLRGHIRSLGPVEAQKSLVLLSAGFLHRALRYDLERLVDRALKTGIIFNTIRDHRAGNQSHVRRQRQFHRKQQSPHRQVPAGHGGPPAKGHIPGVPGPGDGRHLPSRTTTTWGRV